MPPTDQPRWSAIEAASSSTPSTRSSAPKASRSFDTPVRTPVANTFAERWIGSIRRELLDRTIIWNRRQLERLVIDYVAHYNEHRPHRSLEQRPPEATLDQPPSMPASVAVLRTTRCDGLINEYENAA